MHAPLAVIGLAEVASAASVMMVGAVETVTLSAAVMALEADESKAANDNSGDSSVR